MQTNKAFTLVELMTVVAIIAILSSVAVPMYTQYVQRGHRSDGMSIIEGLLAAQQEFFSERQTYTRTLGAGGLNLTLNNSRYLSPDGYYEIKLERCKHPITTDPMDISQCVEVVAQPQGSQTEDGELRANTIGLKQRIQTIDGVRTVHDDFR